MFDRSSRMQDSTSSDPLAYAPQDSAGICLDVDGTIHRTGSIFIETLVFLPYVDAVTWDRADREQFREVVAQVAEYADGPEARDRWLRLFSALDRLDTLGAGWISRGILETALWLRTWRESHRSSTSATESEGGSDTDEDYREMRHAVLEAYGDLISGKRREDLEAAATEIVNERFVIDTVLRETLERAARTDTDVYLVTDMPEHVARAYARRLTGTPDKVVATSFALDGEGRFTGDVQHVDKRRAVRQLRETRRWDYLIAAGDSAVDLEMAETANLFLAVEGQGDVMTALDPETTVRFDSVTDAAALREAFRDGRDVIEVERDQDLSAVLSTALEAVGIADTEVI